MTYANELLDGLSVDLAAIGVGDWDPHGPYAPGVRGIVQNDLPESPDEVVAVTVYDEGEVATYRRDNESVILYAQVRFRVRDPGVGLGLVQLVRDRYHRRSVNLGALRVTGRRVSSGLLGSDQNGRSLFSINLSFTGLRARS